MIIAFVASIACLANLQASSGGAEFASNRIGKAFVSPLDQGLNRVASNTCDQVFKLGLNLSRGFQRTPPNRLSEGFIKALIRVVDAIPVNQRPQLLNYDAGGFGSLKKAAPSGVNLQMVPPGLVRKLVIESPGGELLGPSQSRLRLAISPSFIIHVLTKKDEFFFAIKKSASANLESFFAACAAAKPEIVASNLDKKAGDLRSSELESEFEASQRQAGASARIMRKWVAPLFDLILQSQDFPSWMTPPILGRFPALDCTVEASKLAAVVDDLEAFSTPYGRTGDSPSQLRSLFGGNGSQVTVSFNFHITVALIPADHMQTKSFDIYLGGDPPHGYFPNGAM